MNIKFNENHSEMIVFFLTVLFVGRDLNFLTPGTEKKRNEHKK